MSAAHFKITSSHPVRESTSVLLGQTGATFSGVRRVALHVAAFFPSSFRRLSFLNDAHNGVCQANIAWLAGIFNATASGLFYLIQESFGLNTSCRYGSNLIFHVFALKDAS